MAHETTTDPDEWEILTAHDLLDYKPQQAGAEDYNQIKERKTFFHGPSLTIQVYTGRDHYEVDLEQCRNSAEMLDITLQIASKAWCSPQTLKDFVACLNQACQAIFKSSPQSVFCPCGQDRTVRWRRAE